MKTKLLVLSMILLVLSGCDQPSDVEFKAMDAMEHAARKISKNMKSCLYDMSWSFFEVTPEKDRKYESYRSVHEYSKAWDFCLEEEKKREGK